MDAVVHARAQIDEAGRLLDQSRQYVGSQRVHRKHMRQPIHRRASAVLAVTDACVVYDRVKLTQSVDLVSNCSSFLDTRQVTDHRSFGAGSPGACRVGSLLVAGMENNLVPSGNQKLSRHLSQPVG